jgi:hypothetical protein
MSNPEIEIDDVLAYIVRRHTENVDRVPAQHHSDDWKMLGPYVRTKGSVMLIGQLLESRGVRIVTSRNDSYTPNPEGDCGGYHTVWELIFVRNQPPARRRHQTLPPPPLDSQPQPQLMGPSMNAMLHSSSL